MLVQSSTTNHITTLTLDRPDKRNALSVELIADLETAVRGVADDDSVRAVIFTGAGKSFCAGMDLRGVMDDAAAMGGMLHGLARTMQLIRRLAVPTIARVNGAAVGGGCGLMVVTDFAITHPEAKVGYPEVSLGVCPAVVAPWLIQRIGAGPARSMLLAGGTVSGERAVEIGLADESVPADRLEARTLQLAGGLAEGGREAMAATKHWLNELDGSLREGVFERAADLSAEVIAGDEAQTRLRRLFSPA